MTADVQPRMHKPLLAHADVCAHVSIYSHLQMYIFGGQDSSGSYLDSLEALDSRTLTLLSVPTTNPNNCSVARAGAAMVPYESRLLVFGGVAEVRTTGSARSTAQLMNDIIQLDLVTYTWSQLTTSSSAGEQSQSHERHCVEINSGK